MADKAMVHGLLMSLSNIWKPRKQIDDMIKGYYATLKPFSSDQLAHVYDKCVNECKKFPLPVEIRERIPIAEQDMGEKFRIFKGRCECGHIGMVIDELTGSKVFRCRKCYSGLSLVQYKQRIRDLVIMMEDKTYRPQWVKVLRGE